MPLAIVALVGLLLAACASGEPAPSECAGDLETAAHAQGLIPPPIPALLPPPLVIADPASPDTALRVDPDPLARGEHAGWLISRDPQTCELARESLSLLPPLPTEAADRPVPDSPLARPAGLPRRVRALLVTGEDPGAAADHTAWRAALALLGAAGRALHAPDRARLQLAVAELCDGVRPEDSVVLITTGPGSPTEGGALVLGDEAVSFRQIGALLAERCRDAGLRVWVLDASFTLDLAAAWVGNAPMVLWRGADAAHPEAARVRPQGGGLLSHALAAHVAGRAEARCAASAQLGPREVADIFHDEATVVGDMLAARWEAVGVPALQNAGLGLDERTQRRERLARALADRTPRDVHVAVGAPGPAGGCTDSSECRLRAGACDLGDCRTLTCADGACVPAVALAFPCDDGSVCTADDRCNAAGYCEGTALDCDDDNPCTLDVCHPEFGCVITSMPAGAPCDDVDVCTLGDRCDAEGQCVGTDADCDDKNPCTTDLCDPAAGCLHAPSKSPCDDGDPCTQQDFCLNGICSGDPIPCSDGLPCTADRCEPDLGCVHPPLPDGLPCDDGQPCTLTDRCSAGVCKGAESPCDDGLACTLDLCEAGGCVHLPPPGTCATPAGCVPVGTHPPESPCLVCASTATLIPDPALEGASCPDDGIPCTLDRCSAGACTHPDQPGFCHRPDQTCVAAGELLSPCLVCKGGGVAQPAPAGSPCDSGDPCSGGDVCTAAGACVSAEAGCCTALEQAACGVDLSGDTSLEGTPDEVISWSCLAVAPFPAPEHTLRFVAPCTGIYTIKYAGPPGLLLFTRYLEDGEAPCVDGTCDSYAAGTTSVLLGAGETALLTVDGNGKVAGPYSLSIDCPCTGGLGGGP
ncbi:MAG: hypothetical protein R3F39_25320 [Myxococcota bacterium]